MIGATHMDIDHMRLGDLRRGVACDCDAPWAEVGSRHDV